MPRVPLANGNYAVAIDSNGGTAQWGFTVDRDAALRHPSAVGQPETTVISAGAGFEPVTPVPRGRHTDSGWAATRLISGGIAAVKVASSDVSAVSATVAAVAPDGPGHLTLFACGAAAPTASTLNYSTGDVVLGPAP